MSEYTDDEIAEIERAAYAKTCGKPFDDFAAALKQLADSTKSVTLTILTMPFYVKRKKPSPTEEADEGNV